MIIIFIIVTKNKVFIKSIDNDIVIKIIQYKYKVTKKGLLRNKKANL